MSFYEALKISLLFFMKIMKNCVKDEYDILLRLMNYFSKCIGPKNNFGYSLNVEPFPTLLPPHRLCTHVPLFFASSAAASSTSSHPEENAE